MQDGGIEVDALKNRPKLTQWVTEYWEAFHYLGSSRIIHQAGIGPIPLSEIVAYMDTIYLRNVDERLLLVRMIQSLDNVYVKHVNDKSKKTLANAKANAKHKHSRKR